MWGKFQTAFCYACIMAKSKYKSHVEPRLNEIKEWVKQGDTQKSIAKKLGIAWSSLKLYLQRGERGEEPYSALLACFVQSEAECIEAIENALKKRAEGYQWEEVITIRKRDPKTGEMVLAEEKHRIVDVPPDPTSIQFFLLNRKRADWKKDRREEEVETRDDLGVIVLPEIEQ